MVNRHNILVFFILLIGLILRIVYLSEVPPGIANDETNIVLNAQSLLHTGQNIPGVVTGILGSSSGDLVAGIHSEISSYLLIPFVWLSNFSWPFVKLPFVLFGLGVCFLNYLIIRKLINKEAGIIVFLLSVINPWLIFFGRSGYESVLSSFFYLLAIYLAISLKGWKILYSLVFFLLGFFCYFSAKTLLLPLGLMTLVYASLFQIKQSVKPLIVLNFILVILLLIYSPLLAKSPAGTRFQELNNNSTQDLVNTNRRASLSFPLANLFENKLIEDLKTRTNASLGEFSFSYLFLDGQPESIPSLHLPQHGFMYLIDLPLILLGLFYLAKYYGKTLIFFLGLLITTMIPNFLNLFGTTYTIRTVILFPVLVMLSATGVYYFIFVLPKKIKISFTILLSVIYLLFFGNFLYVYFSRMPVEKSEGWFFEDRVLAKYLTLQDQSRKTIVVSSSPKLFSYRYLLFSNLYKNTNQIIEINQKLSQKDYRFGNVLITNSCPEELDKDTTLIFEATFKCGQLKQNEIASIKDGRILYYLVNETFCNPLVNQKYPLIKDVKDLNIESLTKEQFCQKFITNR
jgi:hypothetical protein